MGGLTSEIVIGSLKEVLPTLLLIVAGAAALEILLYLLLHKVFRSKYALPYTLLAPAAIGLIVFVLYPFLYDVQLAFSDARLQTLSCYSSDERIQQMCQLPTDEDGNRILFSLDYGIKNFQRVFFTRNVETGKLQWGTLLYTQSSTFPNIFARTLLWTAINVFFHVTGGMILALLMNRKLALRGLYRTLIVIPWAIPQVIVALAWRGEFHSQYGFVNLMLGQIGIAPIPWLRDPTWAFVAAIIVNVWLGIPFMMIIILGGLQSISHEYYEAAQIDGATKWQQFWQITMPMLRPILAPAATLGTIWTFNQFNVIWLVTRGGPEEKTDILVTALYNAAIGNSRYAFGAAFAVIIFLILLVFAVIWMNLSGALKGVYE
jgi:arabinogalactan oligomer/maltooligosaccharide transport system permease protein